MATTYDPTGAFRGTPGRLEKLRDRLGALPDASGLAAVLRESGVQGGASPDDPLLDAMREALTRTVFSVTIVNSGPGGSHQHHIDAGANAVSVRLSDGGEDRGELAVSQFPILHGQIARLVRFQPGTAPEQGQPALEVDPGLILDLSAEDGETREAAFARLLLAVGDSIDPEAASASWQLVQSRAAWTGTEGQPVEKLSVYLRAGDRYFVLEETSDGAFLLVPVPSIEAWEAMTHVLPGNDEVKDPRS